MLRLLIVASATLALGLLAQHGRPTVPFTAVSAGAAAQDTGRSRGVAWADADGDGDSDLFVNRSEGAGGFYRNDNGQLTRSAGGPLASLVGVEGAAWVDLDGDGDLDLHVVSRTAGRAFTFRNEGEGRLETVAAPSLALEGMSASFVCWSDVDQDVDLDGFVVGYRGSSNRFLRNDGGFTFAVIDPPEPARGSGEGRACAWGDLENDGLPDLYLAVAERPNVLLRNRGSWSFEPVASGHVVEHVAYSYGASWADVDDDGDLDLFVANFDRENVLYLNRNGNLQPVEGDPIVTDTGGASKGHVWGDFDNDGDQDLYVANGTPAPGMWNWLYLNDGAGRFRRAEAGPATADADTSAGAAAADYDGDGDLDLYVTSWGSPGTRNRLYRNETRGSSWIALRLRGTVSNGFGVGAHVKARAVIGGEPRWMHRWVSVTSGYASQSPYEVHFGLGDAAQVDSVVVQWPSGREDLVTNLATRRRWDLVEGSGTAR